MCVGGRGQVYYSQLRVRVNFDACSPISIPHTATCAGTTLICTGTKAVVRDDCALFCEPLHVCRLLSKERKRYKQREVPRSVILFYQKEELPPVHVVVSHSAQPLVQSRPDVVPQSARIWAENVAALYASLHTIRS